MQKYYDSNQGKENNISYKLRETEYKMNNDINNNSQSIITLSSLKKLSKELGENMSDEELKDMLEKASNNGVELAFEELYDIMTNNIISLNK
jgi:Ca2+-binding EF-hand superfamily protein